MGCITTRTYVLNKLFALITIRDLLVSRWTGLSRLRENETVEIMDATLVCTDVMVCGVDAFHYGVDAFHYGVLDPFQRIVSVNRLLSVTLHQFLGDSVFCTSSHAIVIDEGDVSSRVDLEQP